MNDKTVINTISTIYFTIVSFLSFIFLLLTAVFIILQNGLYIDSISIPNIQVKQLYIKWNEKVDISIKEISVVKKESNNKAEFNYKELDKYLKTDKKKPLFIWVHYFDPHNRYKNWQHINFKTPLPTRPRNKTINNYDKEIRYTDDHIKQLYIKLADKGITKNLITCITADHGEQLFEHGHTFCHADFYSETTFVPLIFHGYKIPKNKVFEKYVSTMDIAPTLLGLTNLSFDYSVEGKDLLKTFKKGIGNKNRKYLIIGNPIYTRSIQLLGYPLSYIQNFDFHYKHWFIAFQKDKNIPEDRYINVIGKIKK